MGRWGAIAVLATMFVAVVPDPAGSSGVAKRQCSLHVSAETLQVGQTLTVAGSAFPAPLREVLLELQDGSKWATVARTNADLLGAFTLSFSVRAPGKFVFRVRLPRAVLNPAEIVCGQFAVVAMSKPGPEKSFRAIYALAADQTADPNAPGLIAHDIESVNAWFATQTNGSVQPRWIRTRNADGSAGPPTVVTVKLAHTAAEYAASSDSFSLLVDDLAKAAPVAASTEKTAVWIDATSYGCGVTGSNVTALFEAACAIYPLANSSFPAGDTYLLAHELTHNFGAVAGCAPHADGTGHVNDDNRDILFQGPKPRDWSNLMLDPGHDDYYATGKPACPGIESSPFWTATSSPDS